MNRRWRTADIPRQLRRFAYEFPDDTFYANLPNAEYPRRKKQFSTPVEDLGALDLLPLELQQMLLSQLDIQTLDNLRRVNRRAMQLVDSIPSYKAIVTQTPFVLRGVLSIEVGRWITCEQLLDELCFPECRNCGDFGGYLYLLGTCERVCFPCFSREKRYLPLSRNEAMRKFGLDWKIVDGLPRMKSIPGTYGGGKRIRRKRLNLVDAESAKRVGIALHGSITAMNQYVLQVAAKKLQEYEERKKTVARPRRPRIEDPRDIIGGNPMRFMAVIRVPWLNKRAQRIEWGFHCARCHYRSRHYLEASLGEHLEQRHAIRI